MLADALPGVLTGAEQFTFLGTGWTFGLASEAALKLREAAGLWAESYPAMEYRHGPIAVTGPGSLVWMLGPAPDGLADEVAAAGGLAWQPSRSSAGSAGRAGAGAPGGGHDRPGRRARPRPAAQPDPLGDLCRAPQAA